MRIDKILTVSLLIAALASCAEDIKEKISEDEAQVININGSILNIPETKTGMGPIGSAGGHEFYPIYWSDGDDIALFSKDSKVVFTLSEVQSDKTKASFVGNAGYMPTQLSGSHVYPAAYPADKAFAMMGADGNLFVGSYLPFQQPYKDNTFADDVFPMASASKNGQEFGFWNLCGVVQIPIIGTEANQTVASIYLSGNNEEVVAGGIGMSFDPKTGEPVTDGTSSGDENNGKKIGTYGSEAYTRIVVNLDEPLELSMSETKYINIAVIPQLFSKGFTLELVDGGNRGKTEYYVNAAITIKRSILTRLSRIDYVTPEPGQIANSYVISEEGYYLMPAFGMGNRMDVKLDVKDRNVNADLLWSELISVNHNTTDRNDLLPAVSNIEYVTDENGYGSIQFKVNNDPNTGEPYRGNAAVALYDEDTKEIIWSWHLWLTEPIKDVITGGSVADGKYTYQLPEMSQPYVFSAEASSGQLIIMDRNLGAVSADPADGWKTYGLYYEDGRRDPFIGGHWDGNPAKGSTLATFNKKDGMAVRIDETGPFGNTTAPVWYNDALAPKGWNHQKGFINLSNTIRYPMTFASAYTTVGNAQWTLYTDADNKSWLDPSVNPGSTHGTTGLTDGGHEAYWNRTKTIMDPCPIGYSMLGERGGLFINSDSKQYIFEAPGGTHPEHGVYGMESTFTYDGTTYKTWWPAAGVRTIDGTLGDVGYRGMYFHFDHISATHGGHGSGFANGVSWGSRITTNHAASIRCVREKQFGNLAKYPLN